MGKVRMTIKRCAVLLILFTLSTGFLFSKEKIIARTDLNEVLLPSQIDKNMPKLISTNKSEKVYLWKEFAIINKGWNVSIDPILQTPILAFGESIKINGFNRITNENVEDAALIFLREYQNTFNINVDQLQLCRKDYVNGKWYVTFKQYYQDYEVLFSRVDLRIYENGKVMAFDIEFYNNIELKDIENISYNHAVELACNSIKGKINTNESLSAGKKYILPIKDNNKVKYNLVYKINVNAPEKHAKYSTYVSTNDGKILWRYNTLSNVQEFNVKGEVKLKTPLSPKVVAPFANMNLKVGEQNLTSGDNGIVSVDINTPEEVIAELNGPWCKVSTEGVQSAYFTRTIEPGKSFELEWNDSNSHNYERNMFYHTNFLHDFMKKLDPNLDCIDKPIDVVLYFEPFQGDSSSNAFSSGDSIFFINCQIDSMRMADGPGVLYHEYGHSINTLFYAQKLENEDGMINEACQEGLADVTAAMMLDDPYVGIGVFINDTNKFIRTCQNNLIFPDSATGESHDDGRILSGAFWDLKELTSLDVMRKLHHFARYGLPDDLNDGVAFYKWFTEVIIADDDDGNIGNGTPHLNEIIKAFNKHQIGSNMYYLNNFKHVALNDTKNTKEPYVAEFSFGNKNDLFGVPDSVLLVYQIKSGKNLSELIYIAATLQSDSMTYKASIPAQAKGCEVFYYVTCKDKFTDNIIRFSSNNNKTPFSFMVGLVTALFDDFEKESGWEVGSTDDNSTIGIWERGKPNKLNFPYIGIYKPGENHTPNGNNCYSTGLGSTNLDEWQAAVESTPNGKTTLTSPTYDLTKLEEATFKYYQYYAELAFGFEDTTRPISDLAFTTEISNNNGKDWIIISKDTSSATEWKKITIKFEDYLSLTSECKIRFSYQGGEGEYGPASIASVSIDDFEIQTANDSIISNVEDNNVNYKWISYPNPFQCNTNIEYTLPHPGKITIKIYDMKGHLLRDLYSGSIDSGKHTATWDSRTDAGCEVASGMYIYRIQFEEQIISNKMILIR